MDVGAKEDGLDKQRQELEVLRRAARSAFRGEEGEKLLAALDGFADWEQDLFTRSETDRQLAYLSGRQSVAGWIHELLKEDRQDG